MYQSFFTGHICIATTIIIMTIITQYLLLLKMNKLFLDRTDSEITLYLFNYYFHNSLKFYLLLNKL